MSAKQGDANMFDKRTFFLGLYCASILIGAGVLALAFPAARLGFVPVMVTIVIGGLYMIYIYRRMAGSLYAYIREAVQNKTRPLSSSHRDSETLLSLDEQSLMVHEVQNRGSRLLAEQARSAIGTSGWVTLVLGMFLFVFFADISYILIGGRSLVAIAGFLFALAPQSSLLLLPVGALISLMAWRLEYILRQPFLLRGALKKVSMMLGTWVMSIAILELLRVGMPELGLGAMGDWYSGLGSILFVSAVLGSMFARVHQCNNANNACNCNDQHTANVLVVVFELMLLVIAATIVIWDATQRRMVIPFFALAPSALTLRAMGDWANLVGLVTFAFVGTGLFNLCSYPDIFENGKGQSNPRLSQVVLVGTLVPMLAYLIWIGATSTVLSPNTLIHLDAAKEYSTIGIAQVFAPVDPRAALLITVFGYSFALLAVTSACNGFTESLADQLAVVVREIGCRKKAIVNPENTPMRLLILGFALVVALVVSGLDSINISSILAVSGNAGGGLLILILPFFFPPLGRRKTTWSAVMIGVTTAFVLAALNLNATNLAAIHTLASGIIAAIKILISLSILGMAIWLIRSEPLSEVQ